MLDNALMSCLLFLSSRRRHTRSYGDWSSDVCSSDLFGGRITLAYGHPRELGEVEKKAPVARLGCTPVPFLLCAHGVTCLSTTYTRAALLYACAVSVELEPMG